LISLTSKTTEWPSVNTLPSIFIEFFDKKLGAWTHVQMTNHNELVYKALGYLSREAIPKWRRYLAANVTTLMINDNSQYGVVYTFKKTKTFQENMEVNFSTKGSKVRFLLKAFKYSFKISFALKIVPLFIFTKMNNQTYHLGGSFPMTTNRTKFHETDTLGRLSAFENVYIVDSSTFPSIPSTTLAILLTANAWRITEESL
jgi:choline dehydrogenase-like flavoprotein